MVNLVDCHTSISWNLETYPSKRSLSNALRLLVGGLPKKEKTPLYTSQAGGVIRPKVYPMKPNHGSSPGCQPSKTTKIPESSNKASPKQKTTTPLIAHYKPGSPRNLALSVYNFSMG